MKCFAALLVLLAIVSPAVAHPPGDGGHHHHGPSVTILNKDNWDHTAPHGKEVDAIYGDAVLRNAHVTAVIAQPIPTRNANMTVRNVGGCLIDLTGNGSRGDQLSSFYPGRRAYPFRQMTQSQDQSSTTVNGKTSKTSSAEVVVRTQATKDRPEVKVAYRLENDNPFLLVSTTFRNPGEKPLTVNLDDDIRFDTGKEQAIKSPNGTSDLYYIEDQYWGHAVGVQVVDDERAIRSRSDSRYSVLEYISGDKKDVALKPGETVRITRRLIPAKNLLEVQAIADSLNGTELQPFLVDLTDGNGEPIPAALVEIKQDGKRRGTGRTNENGELATSLPAGKYEINVTAFGVSLSRANPTEVEIDAVKDDGVHQSIQFGSWKPGRVIAKITGENGKPIPCKVEFRPQGDTHKPYFGPESAEYGVINLQYAPHGTFDQKVPAGIYEVVISHGPEFDAATQELTVAEGEKTMLTAELKRTVDTTGWISSDFHSHSSPSGDNTSSQTGRVINLLCEHIEYAPCTEHNRIDTYVPILKKLGIEDQVATVSGMELTGSPLPLNHQNVFPMIHHPHEQDGGGPVTDVSPETQIERIMLWDNRSEKLIQQNHPDIGWLFYDKNGDGKPDGGYSRSHEHIHVMEIHPVDVVLRNQKQVKEGNSWHQTRIFHWLQLLNQGYRIPGVVNTDAHYNYHGSGGLRNWIRTKTDDPAEVESMDLVRNSKAGQLVMSNGPFLEFTVSEPDSDKSYGPGDDFQTKSRTLVAHVRVQCPNWLDVDRVFLMVNGRVHSLHDYRRSTHADKFQDGVVKFDQELELEVAGDAHIIAVAGAENRTVGPIMGPGWGKAKPAALTNPVFVDTDGNGFTPNKDTLGVPLPVKKRR
ncbi:CehA/McbA family metallohydrolase [Thalassoroseus pseudoceratinae]|uniref:CehA/McbA family metallohydrolase n=1 Tax=Thalassoroseus pseudoceratinae TaxID=2713176 RepID=UPI001421F54F|nr:CehA/McbA family metallohydrolase [Thalassoroseus pseudoceratinae]